VSRARPAPFSQPLAEPDLTGNEEAYVRRAIRAGHISGAAPEVAAFEDACARALGVPHAVACTSGTAALHLALEALGVGPGAEVIVPDLTYVAAANVVRYTGATPVLVDVDPETWTIDPEQAAARIGPRTRAILAVHVYGNPADLDRLRRLARQAKVALVEDAAEAFGATWSGRAVGGIGDVGCFSFFANKVVTTGEGGLVTTRSQRIATSVRALRDQAKSAKRPYFHARLAFNYRLSALQAALGLAQIERLDALVERRARIRSWYREELDGVTAWREPRVLPQAEAVNWLYTGALDGWSARRRDRCLERLRAAGIDARPVFVPMSALPEFRGAGGGPVARRLAQSGISLPTRPRMRRRDVAGIAAALRAAVDG
jgi:perosamine synthetase